MPTKKQKILPPKKCAGCGDEYQPKYAKQQFCRRGCSNLRRVPHEECLHCEKQAVVKGLCRNCHWNRIAKHKRELSTCPTMDNTDKKK